MALVQIDEIGSQPLQRRIQLFLDLRARQPLIATAHIPENFGAQNVGIAPTPGQRFAKNRLRRAPAIDIRGIEEIDAEIECPVHASDRLLLLDADAVSQPRAKRDFRDVQIAGAEFAVFHPVLVL